MSKKTKLTVDFANFEEYAEKMDRLGGDLKAATNKALEESKELVDKQLQEAMESHKRTGQTEGTIMIDAQVEWSGTIASVNVGFDIAHGGLASVFLMYGTPRMQPDKNLYNAIYGRTTKKKVKELQEEIFAKAIKEKMGG